MRRLSASILLISLFLMACAAPPARSPISQPAKPALIEFYADWWEKCQRTRLVVDRLEAEFGGQVLFMRYNIDDPASDAAKGAYQYRAQPQIVITDASGSIVVSRLSELTYVRLKDDLDAVLHEPQQRIITPTKDSDREE